MDIWEIQCTLRDEEWTNRPHVRSLPGWAYARSLALHIEEGSQVREIIGHYVQAKTDPRQGSRAEYSCPKGGYTGFPIRGTPARRQGRDRSPRESAKSVGFSNTSGCEVS